MRKNKMLMAAGAALMLSFAVVGLARADGGIFVPRDFSGYETGQKAFIYFTGQSETLVVSANFRGNAKDFSWVVPTPAKPQIDKADPHLFDDLLTMTNTGEQPVENMNLGLVGGAATQKSSVQVIEQKKVGIYDTAVLKATDEKALAKWLDAHGYTFPTEQNSELKSYVDGGWYFAIAKIQPDFANLGSTSAALQNGTLTPLKLTFASNKIIYPMKLTGIALRSAIPSATATVTAAATLPPGAISETVSLDMPIKLYVLSDHKVQNDALQMDFANWASASNVSNLNTDLGAQDISPSGKYYLTAMSAPIPAKKIADDFTFTNAANDDVYPTPPEQNSSFWAVNIIVLILTPIGFALFPPGLLFILCVVLQRYAVKSKWVYVLGLIYETLLCVGMAVTSIGMLVAISDGSWTGFTDSPGLLGFFVGLVIILAAAVFFTVRMFMRYRKVYSSGKKS